MSKEKHEITIDDIPGHTLCSVNNKNSKVYCCNCVGKESSSGCIRFINGRLFVFLSQKILNKNNDCLYYKRKWWKFWVK